MGTKLRFRRINSIIIKLESEKDGNNAEDKVVDNYELHRQASLNNFFARENIH